VPNKKSLLKWSLILLLACLVIAPLQMLFLIDYETDKAYWCGADHFNTVRCEEAAAAVAGTLVTLVVLTLALVGSLGVILDRTLLPPDHDHNAQPGAA